VVCYLPTTNSINIEEKKRSENNKLPPAPPSHPLPVSFRSDFKLYRRNTSLHSHGISPPELVSELDASHRAVSDRADEQNGPDAGDDAADGEDQDIHAGHNERGVFGDD